MNDYDLYATPNDSSPWRCPECGNLMKDCLCEEGDAESEWQDRVIESDFEDF